VMLATMVFAWTQVLSVPAADERVKSRGGALPVETMEDLIIQDAARKKDLSCKAHAPKSGGPYPVILFSHGFGGNKDAFGPVAKHWASNGYVVIHPTHADGMGRPANEPKQERERESFSRAGPRGLLGRINDPKEIKDRVADLVLILDNLEDLSKSVPGLMGKIDAKRIGVGGHSFGAYTAMLIGGVTADLGKDHSKSFLDARVKCILPISGQGSGQQGLTEKSWRALKLPMMTITGSRDRGAAGQGVEWKKEPYKFSPPGDKYLVVINGANHFSFGGRLGVLGEDITHSVKLCSTHFWNAYLKDAEVSRQYLQSNKLLKDAGNKFVFEKK